MLILFCSCSSDEENPIIPEPEKGGVEIQTRVMVDGEDVTGSYASTAAGYTTGDGKYSEGAPVVVTATANPGYTLVSFTDNKDHFGASSYSFRADIDRFFWAKFSQNSVGTISIGIKDYLCEYNSSSNQFTIKYQVHWTVNNGPLTSAKSYTVQLRNYKTGDVHDIYTGNTTLVTGTGSQQTYYYVSPWSGSHLVQDIIVVIKNPNP